MRLFTFSCFFPLTCYSVVIVFFTSVISMKMQAFIFNDWYGLLLDLNQNVNSWP